MYILFFTYTIFVVLCLFCFFDSAQLNRKNNDSVETCLTKLNLSGLGTQEDISECCMMAGQIANGQRRQLPDIIPKPESSRMSEFYHIMPESHSFSMTEYHIMPESESFSMTEYYIMPKSLSPPKRMTQVCIHRHDKLGMKRIQNTHSPYLFCVNTNISMHIYIYIYIYMHTHT
jgi:hypothetical protein